MKICCVDDNLASSLDLPPVDQVAWIVRDLDCALKTFEPMFGKFHTMVSDLRGCNYRGREADVTLKIAFGRSGPLEIELIEVVSGEGPHREMLEKHGEGIHHVRFKIEAIEALKKKLESLGFHVIWSHELPEYGAKWAYLEGPAEQGGAMVELYEMSS